MPEVYKAEQNLDGRPFGRFLLARENEDERDQLRLAHAFRFAEDFSSWCGDILHETVPSHLATVVVAEDGKIRTPRNERFYINGLRLEFDKSFSEQGTYIWKVISGHEQYDFVLNEEYSFATRYDFSNQGDVMTRQTVTDDETLEGLQVLVEKTLAYPSIREAINDKQIRRRQDLLAYIALLESSTTRELDFREKRNFESLKRQKDKPRLETGSTDRRFKRPLIRPGDWRPKIVYADPWQEIKDSLTDSGA